MEIHRLLITRGEIRRIVDLNEYNAEIAREEAARSGWQVSWMVLEPDAPLLPGILEEPVDLLLN